MVAIASCQHRSLSSLSNDEINALLAQVDENDAVFIEKGVTFDSVVTYVGTRELESTKERMKMKLFYFNGVMRGYYNLPDTDQKNLQIFGKEIEGNQVLKCVSNLISDEQGSYLIVDKNKAGIWASPHQNYKLGTFQLRKSAIDYATVREW
jgi:hypothetical protein